MIFFNIFVLFFNYFFIIYFSLSELQLSGYNVLYPAIYMCRLLKSKLIYFLFLIFFNIVTIVIFYSVFVVEIGVLFIDMILVFCIFFNRNNFKNLKHTKRMIRIIFISFLLYVLIMYVILRYVVFYNWIFFNLICIFFSPVVLSLSLICLFPIEKVIGKYYISKAKKIIKKSNLIKVGITGSFGKTSVKEILSAILAREYSVLSTPKSYNTPLGISKTINENFKNTNEVFVCEMGAKNVGEIKELCDIVNVDFGVVTAVGRQHMKSFGSIDNIYKTKYELPAYLNGKQCVFNLMNLYTFKMFREYTNSIGIYLAIKHNFFNNIILKTSFIYKCGFSKQYLKFFEYPRCYVYSARNISLSSSGSQFDVYYCSQFLFRTSLGLIGIHNIINCLLALAMAKLLNVGNKNIDCGIRNIKKIDARSELIKTKNGGVVINNGYNSNIDSVDFMLKSLLLFNKKNIVIVSPGLIESENDYFYNVLLGKKFTRVATEIVIIKEKNKLALLDGIRQGGFDMNKVRCLAHFSDIKKEINNCDEDSVYLIENDLPDNYK